MSYYGSHKRPSQLDIVSALTDADLVVLQVDGENKVSALPIAVLAAHISGAVYRAGTASLNAGANVVNFSSALPNTSYTLHYYTRNADGYAVGDEVTSKTVNGFGIDVAEACTINYYAIPNK